MERGGPGVWGQGLGTGHHEGRTSRGREGDKVPKGASAPSTPISCYWRQEDRLHPPLGSLSAACHGLQGPMAWSQPPDWDGFFLDCFLFPSLPWAPANSSPALLDSHSLLGNSDSTEAGTPDEPLRVPPACLQLLPLPWSFRGNWVGHDWDFCGSGFLVPGPGPRGFPGVVTALS